MTLQIHIRVDSNSASKSDADASSIENYSSWMCAQSTIYFECFMKSIVSECSKHFVPSIWLSQSEKKTDNFLCRLTWKFQKLWLMNALETAADSTQHAWLGQSTAHRSRFRSSVIASAPSQCVDVGVVAVTNWTANFITHLCCWWQLRISWWIHCPIFLSDERWIIFYENHVGYGAKCVIPRNNCDNHS